MIWWNLRRDGREYFSGRTMVSAESLAREAEAAETP
jgi:hypothetical protein